MPTDPHSATGDTGRHRPSGSRAIGLAAGAVGLAAIPLAVGTLLGPVAGAATAGVLATAAVVTASRLGQCDRAALKALGDGLERLRRGRLTTPVSARGGAEVARLAGEIDQVAQYLRETNARTQARELALVKTLAQVAEGRTPESANHMTRVGAMCCELGRLAGLTAEEAEMLRRAAPLHDLGQVGMPEAILAKPGTYTPREREAMKAHTEIGHRILSGSPRRELRAAAEIALTHHERWDGQGYPRGLAGEDIPLHGRIVGLIDAFDAMFSERAYRQAMSRAHGLGIIRSQRGHHFDPRLVDLLLENLPAFFGIMEKHADVKPVRKAGAARGRRPSTVRG
ncbi:MAG: HD domain-containing protein [bacterium]|nr:HD domain-containing protein [bacterium]